MKKPSLLDRLTDYAQSGMIPFHMPGHMRNMSLAPYLAPLGGAFDITEIPDFDDLHAPEGFLAELKVRTAALWGSDEAHLMVNGSTGGLLAGIRAATKRGDEVLVARNCHKAVYHGIELCGLQPHFLLPQTVAGFGCAGSITPAAVAAGLRKHPNTKLVILVSPSFDGIRSDIKSIAALCHARKIPLLVDEAHGAHLGLHPSVPESALCAGADLVVQSLHKTLPSLTQTAVLHHKGSLVDAREVRRQLAIFQSSSPSYLHLASIDGCIRLLETEQDRLFPPWQDALRRFREKMKTREGIRLLSASDEAIFALEPSKLVFGGTTQLLDGRALMTLLETEFQMQLEMASLASCTAMTGLGTTEGMLDALFAALETIDKRGVPYLPTGTTLPTGLHEAEQVYPLWEAVEQPYTLVPWEEAAGKVAAESLWLYPPGIPSLIPGERITQGLLEELDVQQKAGLKLLSTRGELPQIAVL